MLPSDGGVVGGVCVASTGGVAGGVGGEAGGIIGNGVTGGIIGASFVDFLRCHHFQPNHPPATPHPELCQNFLF